jgi:peptide deformylase
MARLAPNFFDDLAYMRRPARAFYDWRDYSKITLELISSCKKYRYLGVSPQNLVQLRNFERIIAVREGRRITSYLNPRIIRADGSRERLELCANVFLMRGDERHSVYVKVPRPRVLVFTHQGPDGKNHGEIIRDTQRLESVMPDHIAVICHEVDHLNGRLIVDHARDCLIRLTHDAKNLLQLPIPEGTSGEKVARMEEGLRDYMRFLMPFVLVRVGDLYELRHGSEYENTEVPPVSEDALFFHGVPESDFTKLRVPRDGDLIPIRVSARAQLWQDRVHKRT